MSRTLPEGFERGPLQGRSIIGETTEALHRFILDGWNLPNVPPPRIEEDLSFVPKDREEVVYIYMFRVGQNQALMNSKRWRETKFTVEAPDGSTEHFYERPPIYLELYYMLGVHAKFRSDAERLLGWLMLRLHEATHLVYRPRRYLLPDGREVDSAGKPWSVDATGDDIVMEKVSLQLTDDLTIGDAINFFTIHEAPYRPYITYKARCAMEGSLITVPTGTTIRTLPLESAEEPPPSHERPSGRLGRMETRPRKKNPPGPQAHDVRPLEDVNQSEE